jgi:hypothetical protein
MVMTSINRNILENIREIYPEHAWIDITDRSIDPESTSIELNLECLKIIDRWLTDTLGFNCEYDFPYGGKLDRYRSISELVNGFCLKVNGHKIVFIPSQNLDLATCDIPQEWLDLGNWRGEYYVPVQIDLEAKYLHLWGSITDERAIDRGKLDPLFRYYRIDGTSFNPNLDVLWASCEFAPAIQQSETSSVATLTVAQARRSIDKIVNKTSTRPPRLALKFSEWGAILNSADYLERYLTATYPTTDLSNWLVKQVENISQCWETIDSFIDPPQPQFAFRSLRSRLRRTINEKKYRDIPLETPDQIKMAIEQLYRSQTEIPTPDKISSIDDLVTLIEAATDDNIRWKATEYLWIIDPQHPKLPTRRIRDLGIQFAADALALMISQLPIDDRRRAILLRVYPLNDEIFLPAGVKLSVFDGMGEPILYASGKPFEAVSRREPRDNYIQLYFVADSRDRFELNVTLDTQQFTEYFVV